MVLQGDATSWTTAAHQRALREVRGRDVGKGQNHVLIYRRPCATEVAHMLAQTRRVLGSAEAGKDKTEADSKGRQRQAEA